MRYSNVHESFLDFIKERKKKETQNVINRIQNFLNKNPQYGYDVDFLLPGLCPLKKMAESIVVTEKYLRNLIRTINYNTIKLFRVNAKLWKGDLVVLMPTEDSSKKFSRSSFKPSIDSFSDYLRDLENYPKRKRYSRRSDYDYSYGYRRKYESHVSESFFSDFISWVKGGSVNKEDINFDNAIFQITHFLVKYPGYDYDKQNDIPGFIFLTSLANAIQVPYDTLLEVFKQNKFENAEMVKFKLEGIEGPVIIFGKPSVERKAQWDSWNSDLTSKSQEEMENIVHAASQVDQTPKNVDIPEEQPETKAPQAAPDVTSKPAVEMIDETKKEKIIQSTVESLLMVFKKVKKESLSSIQRILIKTSESISEENNMILLKDFVSTLFVNDLEYLKSSTVLSELFIEKDGQKKLKDDLSEATIGIKLSNFIWNDVNTINKLIEFYKSSVEVIDAEKIDVEKEEEVVEPKQSEREISATEDILRTGEFLKKSLESLKEKSSKTENKTFKEILEDSEYDDSVMLALKGIIKDFPNFSDDKKKSLINNVFIEYKNKPNTYFITQNIDPAVNIFTDYLLNEIPDILSKKIEDNI